MPEGRWRVLVLVSQVVASVVVLLLLLHEADVESVGQALARCAPFYLLLAVVARMACLTFHNLRIWVVLREWGPVAIGPVMGVGFLGGLLNAIIPVRAGDLATIALLSREQKVPTAIALSTVGLVSVLEAAIFGVFLCGVLVVDAARWDDLLGVARRREAMGLVTVLTLGGLGLVALVVVIGRLVSHRSARPEGVGPMRLLLDMFRHTGQTLGYLSRLGLHLGLAVAHVLVTVGAVYLLLPAARADVMAPILAACTMLAVGAFSSLVLPPSMAAGPAAASVLVLGFFGVVEAQALAVAALAWFTTTTAAFILGFPPILHRLSVLRGLGLFRKAL